jgi:hypothetical protein
MVVSEAKSPIYSDLVSEMLTYLGTFYVPPLTHMLFPYTADEHGFAWCGWVQVDWKVEEWCYCHRPCSYCYPNAKEAWCCWQVC